MMKTNKPTYISLFSSAGVGCYGFKLEDFDCVRDFTNEYRENISELTMFIDGQDDNNVPTQAHHIFPKNEFPEIMHYVENLIMLTPNQHYSYAHPNNNTYIIDLTAQKNFTHCKDL